MEITAGWLFL